MTTITTVDLLQHLLDNRHKYPSDGVIPDCLQLHALVAKRDKLRITWDEIALCWGCLNQTHTSKRLMRLVRLGLVDYEPGVQGDPGYLFWRVGPAL